MYNKGNDGTFIRLDSDNSGDYSKEITTFRNMKSFYLEDHSASMLSSLLHIILLSHF